MNKLAIAFIGLALSAITASAQLPEQTFQWLKLASTIQYGTTTPEPPAGYAFFENEMMTASNSTLSGLTNIVWVKSSSVYSSDRYSGWRTMEGSTDNCQFMGYYLWHSANQTVPHWLEYDCGVGNSNVVTRFHTIGYANYSYKVFNFLGSLDGTNYTVLLSNSAPNVVAQRWVIASPAYYRFYRFLLLSGWTDNYARLYWFNMSSADYETPMMTATNNPVPYVATASSSQSGHPAYQVFDGNGLTAWAGAPGTNYPHWIQMDFGSNIVINGFNYMAYYPYSFKSYFFEGSLDETNYTEIGTGTFSNIYGSQIYSNSNTTAYRYYRLLSTNGYSSQPIIRELTFKHY